MRTGWSEGANGCGAVASSEKVGISAVASNSAKAKTTLMRREGLCPVELLSGVSSTRRRPYRRVRGDCWKILISPNLRRITASGCLKTWCSSVSDGDREPLRRD
jgi:hypothetical protein